MTLPSRRTLIGIALAAVAAALTLLVSRPAPTTTVVVAARDVAAGRALTADDLDVAVVPVAIELPAPNEVSDAIGLSLIAPVSAKDPLLHSLLRPPVRATYSQTMSLEVERAHGVLGDVVAGDRVDVYVTTSDVPEATRVAADVYVVESHVADDTFGAATLELLIAVDAEMAAIVAAASHSGDIDLVRVTP